MRMKKSLLLWNLAFLLTSCQVDFSSLLEEDKKAFVKVENFVSENLPFSTSLVSEKKNSTFMNVISLSSFDKDYHRVRVLLSPDKDYFVFFGYEDNYTIVTDTKDVNQEKNCYAGISITFHSSVKIESLYAYFQSEEKSFYFTLS